MRKIFAALCLALVCTACGAKRPNYSLFEQNKPRSILILPPLNSTAAADAAYKYFSTVTVPVAERGYYVIPVSISDRLLKENGVIGPEEMRQVSRDKLRSIFGADAVLDMTIDEWGTSYYVISAGTTVGVTWHLIDLRTGQELWTYHRALSVRSGDSGGGIVGALVGALAHAVEGATSDMELPVARQLNNAILMNSGVGLLPGPRWVEKPN